MLLYTPLPIELVIEGIEELPAAATRSVEIEGVPVVVEDVGQGKYRILKLLSTNPYDYLRPNLYPGAVIKYQG